MMSTRAKQRGPSRLRLLVGLGALGLAAAGAWLVLGGGERPPAGEGGEAFATQGAAPGSQPLVREGELRAPNELELVVGEAVAIPLASLRRDRPLVLDLPLPEAVEGAEPLEVRVYREDESPIELRATLGSGGRRARVELDAATLRPGRHLVEVATREPSHFPLRRYLLELR